MNSYFLSHTRGINTSSKRHLLCYVMSLFVLNGIAAAEEPSHTPLRLPPPRVWIFNGLPGGQEHHVLYEKNLVSLRHSLTKRFGVPNEHITVLYGPQSAGYDGPCTKESLLAELAHVTAHFQKPEATPVWLVFLGHANDAAGTTFFNIPGPDISAREIGEALRNASARANAPLVVWATTTASAPFVTELAGSHRVIISATSKRDRDNETEFPTEWIKALASDDTDSNRDGLISITELFLATKTRVLQHYESQHFILNENAELDGNGDGKATPRPAAEDAGPAETIGLSLHGTAQHID